MDPRTTLVFDCPLSPWILGSAAVALLAVVAVVARRDVAPFRRALRYTILTLILIGGAMLTALALSPKVIRTWEDPQKPRCVILVDGSRSMLIADQYSTRSSGPPGGATLTPAPPPDQKPTREQAARLLLSDRPDQWLPMLREKFDLSAWRFASELESLPVETCAASYKVNGEGYTTALAEALEQAAAAEPGRRPRAIILISDGAWNTGRDPSEAARVLGSLGIPVFVIALGDPNPPRDLAVASLKAPKRAVLGDEILLTAEIVATGIDPARVNVQLTSGTELIAEKQVVTLPGGRPLAVRFSFVPREPGVRLFSARIAKLPGEQNESNNEESASVEVAERKIAVLMVEDEPRWEFRFIRNVLERDPAMTATVCLLRPGVGPISGVGYAGPLPAKKNELTPYDLVILGDVDRANLSDAFLTELAEMVRTRGTALIVLAGPRHHYRELTGTPLAPILPVRLDRAAGISPASGQPFNVELTQDGSAHLITRLASDAETNDLLWAHLPQVQWAADVGELARGAAALLVHPNRLAGASKLPLLAVHRVGAGKVLFCGIDETWRWRRAVGDKYHFRFWAQTVRWMVRKPFAEGDPRARLSIDRTECDVGETVEVEAYCLAPDGFPLQDADVQLAVTGPGGRSDRIVMKPAEGGWGIYRAQFAPPRAGKYEMRPVISRYGQEPLASTVSLDAARQDLEKRFTAQNLQCLTAIAQASGGQYLAPGEAHRIPSLVAAKAEPRLLTAEFSPCRHWAYYTALVIALASAWGLRKRSGLP